MLERKLLGISIMNDPRIPQRKKRRRQQAINPPFPVPIATVTNIPASEKNWYYFTGELEGDHVLVKHSVDIQILHKMGFFGRGLLSQGAPDFYKRFPNVFIPQHSGDVCPYKVARRRMFLRHCQWEKSHDHRLPKEKAQATDWNEEYNSDVEYEPVYVEDNRQVGLQYATEEEYQSTITASKMAANKDGPDIRQQQRQGEAQKSSEAIDFWESSHLGKLEGVFQHERKDLIGQSGNIASWDVNDKGDADFWGCEDSDQLLQSVSNTCTHGCQSFQTCNFCDKSDVQFNKSDSVFSNQLVSQTGETDIKDTRTHQDAVNKDNKPYEETEPHLSFVIKVAGDCGVRYNKAKMDTGISDMKEDGCDTVDARSTQKNAMKENSVYSDRAQETCDTHLADNVIDSADNLLCNFIDTCKTFKLEKVDDTTSGATNSNSELKENHEVIIENNSKCKMGSKNDFQTGGVEKDFAGQNDEAESSVDTAIIGDNLMEDKQTDTDSENMLQDATGTEGLENNKIIENCSSESLVKSQEMGECFEMERILQKLHPSCETEDPDGDFLVIDDSDSEAERGLRPVKQPDIVWEPVLKRDPYPVQEPLILSLEEAFFLSFGLGCLTVQDGDKVPLTLVDLWQRCCEVKIKFLPHYIAYHYFRSKGWVPKPGLLFGVDFILYKIGPPFYHGSYSVIIRTVHEDNFTDVEEYTDRKFTWTTFCGLHRVTEHVAKVLMICYVILPDSLTEKERRSPNCISKFKIKLQVINRWISSQERGKEPEEIP